MEGKQTKAADEQIVDAAPIPVPHMADVTPIRPNVGPRVAPVRQATLSPVVKRSMPYVIGAIVGFAAAVVYYKGFAK